MTATTNAVSPLVLVLDDEPDLRTLYELSLVREGYRVQTAGTVAEALQQLDSGVFDAVITDMRLPDGSGLDVLRYLAQHQRAERCVVMTAYGSADNAVEALKAGAFDYLTKPVDFKQFRAVVASAVEGATQSAMATAKTTRTPKATEPRARTENSDDSPGQRALARLVGASSAMRMVRERVGKVARSMAPVLIRGESGTGKELVARAIHACSHRSNGPFVAVNCGAIPENLLEAEFFGARKGAYTGASQDRLGYFQTAHGGTLFLDEVGDLPLAMQVKLLRAIQERSVRALGSAQEEIIDARIVSATHRDLSAAVASSVFRQDLYYRLNVIEIVIAPLRERREDLADLSRALLERIATDTGHAVGQFTPEALEILQKQPLLGNVRELENLLHRAVALSDDGVLSFDDVLPQQALAPFALADASLAADDPSLALAPSANPLAVPEDLQAHLDAQERAILVLALAESGFNRTAAAVRLGISLRQIRYRMARLNIEADSEAAS